MFLYLTCRILEICMFYFLGVEASSKVALAGAPATLTCRVTGLAEDNAVEISWLPSYSGVPAGGNLEGGAQTSTLIIGDPQTDKTYICQTQSKIYAESPSSETGLYLDIFSEYNSHCPTNYSHKCSAFSSTIATSNTIRQ